MRWAVARRTGVVGFALAAALTSCSSAPSPTGSATLTAPASTALASTGPALTALASTGPALTALASSTAQSTMPATADSVQQQVQQAIDTFNAAAGGPVSRQQRALDGLVDAGQRSVQSSCAAASSTLTFEPVYARLVPAPGWTPSRGTLSGTVYSLPTLIRIRTGNRITGTDLTDLHVAVADGRAWFPALCLN